MKKLSYLIVLTLILGLVLTGCLLTNVGQVPTTEQSGITYLTKGTETEPDSFTLYAGQDIRVGDVLVWNDEDNLYVKYLITDPDWCITETHLHVAASFEDIPQTKKNNPIPGQFNYKEEHDCVTEYTYTIPLTWEPCTEFYIAAHAEVIKYGTVCVDFEEYSEYDTVSTVSTLAGDVNFYMTDYSGLDGIIVGNTVALLPTGELPVIAAELTKDPDHDWMDTTMQNIVGFTVDGTFEDDWVKADPDSTGAGGKLLTDTPDFDRDPFWQHAYSKFQAILMDFTQINMPKSVSFAGVDLDWNEVWYILYFDMNNTLIHIAIEGPPVGQSGDGVAFPISYSNPDIDKIVIWGNMNGGTPGKVGFAIDNICLEAVIQEETAWADGRRFTEKGNWATYFTYTIPCCPCINSASDNIEVLDTPPANVRVGILENDEFIRVWKEFEGTLTEDLYYDLDEGQIARINGPNSPSALKIDVGTPVCIYYVHLDNVGPTSTVQHTGHVTFGADIMGLIISGGDIGTFAGRNLMFNADSSVGNTATTYPIMVRPDYLRGFDVNYGSNLDDAVFSGPTVDFTMWVVNAHDSFRVILPMVP